MLNKLFPFAVIINSKNKQKNLNILLILAMSSLLAMIFLDQTGTALILPILQHDIHISSNAFPWIINSYLLSISGALIFTGKLGDICGHKCITISGAILFMLFSILCATANSSLGIISARIGQGIGAAFIIPSIGVVILNSFPKEVIGRAMSAYVGVASIFLSLGPFIGGMVARYFSWRILFWVNVPISIISILLTFFIVKNIKKSFSFKDFDWLGGLTFAISLISFTLLLSSDTLNYIPHQKIIFFTIGSSLFCIFIYIEKKTKDPLVHVIYFKNEIFVRANIIFASIQLCLINLIFISIYIQNILGYSVEVAGLFMLPATLPTIFISPLSGALLDKYGGKVPVLYGMLLLTIGMFWIAFFITYQKYWIILPGLLLFGLGVPLAMQPIFTIGLSSFQPSVRGAASSIINIIKQMAATLGFAFINLIITTSQKVFPTIINNNHFSHTTNTVTASYACGIFFSSIIAFIGLILTLITFKDVNLKIEV